VISGTWTALGLSFIIWGIIAAIVSNDFSLTYKAALVGLQLFIIGLAFCIIQKLDEILMALISRTRGSKNPDD